MRKVGRVVRFVLFFFGVGLAGYPIYRGLQNEAQARMYILVGCACAVIGGWKFFHEQLY